MQYSNLSDEQKKEINFSSMNALIVDDQEPFRRLLELLLTKEFKMRVKTAENPKEAFEYLNTADHLPSIIMLDMQMPIMDGKTALKHLRKNSRTKKIPVVAFTALGNETLIKELAGIGISGFIVKPGSREVILDKVYSILSKVK